MEEDIKILEELIKYYEKELSSAIINDSYRWSCERNKKAIEHLIERNKELEDIVETFRKENVEAMIQKRQYELHYIPKSKIKKR